ncbi:heptosyltransferase-3 [Desulfonatronum thiosulfatophilum]|uniref:Heptosyltransferase-3 n=1 Tax=Desulfonatronum thiosulfatophilum TaxID=617002 RepID=A0A1G6BD75_9BACT|nr:glycosyltransferase family 9 protein [Desulfonatronum thiosulfatophilum]SDB18571.1 heptosyltransferase-3 [Desulfonatronum thiosulfatophilum]
MKFLFIKLKHIGDSLLLTSVVRKVRETYPRSLIWVVVRQGCEGILAGCPDIDRILTAAAPEKAKRSHWNWASDLALAAVVRRERFDYAFELGDGDRGRWLTLVSGARHRCANAAGRPLHWWWRRTFTDFSNYWWYKSHQVEKEFYTVSDCLPAPLNPPLSPLRFVSKRTQDWPPARELTDFVLLHPGTRWSIKRWPEERWRDLCVHLLRRIPNILLSCGPDVREVDLCARLMMVEPGRIMSTAGRASWAQLAGLLYRARLFVGVDTAAMHLAAACSCPTVALFIGSRPEDWSPWQTRNIVVQPRADKDLQQPPAERISLEQVLQACDALLQNEPAP